MFVLFWRTRCNYDSCKIFAFDCVFHLFATILGIRPDAPGFAKVRIEPRLGSLKKAKGALVHPKGVIEADLREDNGRVQGIVTLPRGLEGVYIANGIEKRLKPGKQVV